MSSHVYPWKDALAAVLICPCGCGHAIDNVLVLDAAQKLHARILTLQMHIDPDAAAKAEQKRKRKAAKRSKKEPPV